MSYVGSTASRGLACGHAAAAAAMEQWCHANYAACTATRRSTTGWMARMYGGEVSWETRKQPKAAASTMAAEPRCQVCVWCVQACVWCVGHGGTVIVESTEVESFCSDCTWDSAFTVFCNIQAALTLF